MIAMPFYSASLIETVQVTYIYLEHLKDTVTVYMCGEMYL